MISTYKNKIPFFSVIISTFNRSKLFTRAIKSLIYQSEKDYEAIIVDDGSSDETTQIAKQYCNDNENFKYIYHCNRGVALSKNAGILSASGLFITFLDSDDEYLENHLEWRKDILTQNNSIDLLHGGVKIIGNPYVPDKNNPDAQIHISKCVVGGTFVVKKSIAEAIGGFNPIYSEDSDFFERAIEQGAIIGETDLESYIYYRNTEDSICNNQ